MKYRARINEDKTIYTPGVDFGPELKYIDGNGEYAVVRIKGHTGWFSVGERAYYPTRYVLAEVSTSPFLNDNRGLVQFNELVEVEAGRHWRLVRDLLVRYCSELLEGKLDSEMGYKAWKQEIETDLPESVLNKVRIDPG